MKWRPLWMSLRNYKMAACMRRQFGKDPGRLIRRFLQSVNVFCEHQRCVYSSKSKGSKTDVLRLFNTEEVQGILTRITGLDLQKVFRHSKEHLEAPTYRLISNTKLKELEEEAKAEARKRLQMPPVLDEREEVTDVLSENPELEGLESSKFVFTDITYGVSDRERFMVVREPSGSLRKATWEERDRISQIYFPRSHRQLVPPPLFDDENISVIFSQDRHEDVLDAACAQFEPDAADFIRVHHRTYEDIEARGNYDLLRSTRHFGGLAFYLARNQRIDGLLADMIQRNLISDAVDLIRLYHILHPDCRSISEVQSKNLDGIEAIKAFIQTDAKRQGRLELVLQAYENEQANQDMETEEVTESQR